jgi:CO/xanthine dehydrogenase FAD-binding subunit
VKVVCLETRDLDSRDRMPALDHEILEAEEEGIIIHPGLGIREIVRSGGTVTGIVAKKCISVFDPDGTFHPRYDETVVENFETGGIIIAIGQASDQSLSEQGLSLEQSSFETGILGTFAGGDMTSGPSTVIQAIASARKAAAAIEHYLNEEAAPLHEDAAEPEYAESSYECIARATIASLPAGERLRSVDVEDVPGLSVGQVRTEARRCLSCGCLAVSPSDLAIALVALDANVVTTSRTLAAQEFFSAGPAKSTVLEKDELIKEIVIPKPAKGVRQNYLKFTLRKPLDFAVVSVACILKEKAGICSDARIVLGAVGPAPVRALAAEEALKGNAIGEEGAAEAARLAFAKAQPLSMNAYKIQIGKTLVKRAIIGS